jgi:DNA polymerase I-like protein with 3'-5' exonuclease and polymerase domains
MVARKQPVFDQFLLPYQHLESSWKLPVELPDLSQETEIAIDTETFDPGLKENKGPGFFKCDKNNPRTGYVCGISCAWRDKAIYIPLWHHHKAYFDRSLVQRWLKSLAAQNHTRFIFHNFQYDWGWLQAIFEVPPPALIDDVQAMSSMINENLPSFSLDNLCKWKGLPGKDERLLKEYAGSYRVKENEVKSFMYEYPAEYVGPYAEQDAMSTLQLAHVMRPLLTEENLDAAYQTERDLMPITLKMKQRGIRVDKRKAEGVSGRIKEQRDNMLYDLSSSTGERVTIKDIRSNHWLKHQFDKRDLVYPKTSPTENYSEGQASFEKGFMANHQHWFPRTVHKIKSLTDLADRFLEKFILDYAHKSRVFPTVNQFRNEGGGARSHRFSYSDPPLQQMPSRDDETAPLIRSCFLPEDGELWCSIDYQQQEYRLIVFVAELLRARGAKRAADMYRNDPKTDFHNYVMNITKIPRRRAKDVNFAKSYGAGVAKFALMTGMSEEEAKKTIDQYDEELPFVREASSHYARYAAKNGYIKLIDGARNHFNLWEPMYRDFAREWEFKHANRNIDTLPCSEEEVNRRKDDPKHPWYGEKMKRAYTHKAFNRMIQGSAARQTKKAMVEIYKAGFQPILQVHDELCFSIKNNDEARACAKIMEDCCPVITLPMLTDIKIGPNWGQLKK